MVDTTKQVLCVLLLLLMFPFTIWTSLTHTTCARQERNGFDPVPQAPNDLTFKILNKGLAMSTPSIR